LGRQLLDSGVDCVAVGDHRGDELAGQFRGLRVAFELGQMALQNGRRGALAEIGLEDGSERKAAAGSLRPNEVRARHAAIREFRIRA